MKSRANRHNIVIRFLLRIYNFFKSLIVNPRSRWVLISSILFFLAYPPLPFGFLAYLCLIPMLVAISGKGFRIGFKSGYLFGLIHGALLLYWVGVGIRSYAESANINDNLFLEIFLWWIAPIGAPIALALIQAIFSALLFGVYGWLSQGRKWMVLLFPLVWTSIEYIRTLSEFAFPWIQLAYTQALYPSMIQTVSWWGDLGLGFWIAFINVLFYFAFLNRTCIKKVVVYASAGVLIIAMGFIYGNLVSYENKGEEIDVALLQGSMTLREKFAENSLQKSMELYSGMANNLESGNYDLIVLPETVIREILLRGSMRYRFSSLARNLNSNILIGTFDRREIDGKSCPYNSAVQCNCNGEYDFVHHKIKLVPFSEKIPYNQHFPFINDFHFGQSDFCMGDSITIFQTNEGNYSVMICFEIGFSEFNRQAVNKGAEFIVTITNDTWWGKSFGPYQHAFMAPFRAVENRRWVVRCANTGFSFFCDPLGRIDDLGPLFEKYTASKSIYTNDEITFFGKHGTWLPKYVLIITFLFILSRFILKLVKRSGRN